MHLEWIHLVENLAQLDFSKESAIPNLLDTTRTLCEVYHSFFFCYSVADSFRHNCRGLYSQNIAHHTNVDPGEKSKGAIAHGNHSEEVGVFSR